MEQVRGFRTTVAAPHTGPRLQKWRWEFGGGFVSLCEKFCAQILLIETIKYSPAPPFNMIRRIFNPCFRGRIHTPGQSVTFLDQTAVCISPFLFC